MKRTYLSAGLAFVDWDIVSVHASPGLSDVKSRVLLAVYKSKRTDPKGRDLRET